MVVLYAPAICKGNMQMMQYTEVLVTLWTDKQLTFGDLVNWPLWSRISSWMALLRWHTLCAVYQ